MAATNNVLQLPSHQHPLELIDKLSDWTCRLCTRTIWSKGYYTCREGCVPYSAYAYHRACAEAPPRIDAHPLHPLHPLTLTHGIRYFTCNDCEGVFTEGSSFRCDECNFDLDTGCALSALPDIGCSSRQITLPIHPHPLTSFSKRHDFVGGSDCYICEESVEADGYACPKEMCGFVIHKRCVQDVYYEDGTKAPTVYHEHPLEIHTSSKICASCGSDESGEFIGCGCCQVFYHRQCFQVPEIITYPSHDPDHTLVLFPDMRTWRDCESCSVSLEYKIYYRCTSCKFLVDIECASKVPAYVEEGMSARIELSWHKHPLHLCHRAESTPKHCEYCEEESIGPMYVCVEMDCGFALHKRCSEVESMITHPHHPDHPLSLCERHGTYICRACDRIITNGLGFSCECCSIDFHVKCAGRFPTHKHYLHEHELCRFEKHGDIQCSRCDRYTDSPLFRCVPCNFNLHEECMELPRVVKSKIHWHPVTLQSKFLEDDSGEYYCEECEQTRDPRLGVYVCGQCHISIPRIYHIHCVFPELAKVYEKDYLEEMRHTVLVKLNERIAYRQDEVSALKEKLENARRQLDELVEKRTGLFQRNVDLQACIEAILEDESRHQEV